MRLRGVGSGLPGTSARYERRLVVTSCAVETVGVSHARRCRILRRQVQGEGRGSRCRRLRERYNGVVEDVYVGVSRRHRRAGLLGSTTSRSQRDRVLGATPPVSGDRRRRDGAPLLLLQQPAQALSQGTAGEGLQLSAARMSSTLSSIARYNSINDETGRITQIFETINGQESIATVAAIIIFRKTRRSTISRRKSH